MNLWIYTWSYWVIFLITAGLILEFAALALACNKRHSRGFAAFVRVSSLVAVCIILWFTVLDRAPSANHNLIFALDPASDEFIREMVLNAFLYVPLGTALPYALTATPKHAAAGASTNMPHFDNTPDRAGSRILNALKLHPRASTVALAFTFSIIIEVWQFITGSGVAQVTDVICNTLGALLGTTSYFLAQKSSTKVVR